MLTEIKVSIKQEIFIILFSILVGLHNQKTEATTTYKNLLAEIKYKGFILFGTEGTYVPYTFHNKNDVLVGFDIDIAHAIADKLGVSAKFMESRWDGLIAGLETKRYDAIINQVGITQKRLKKFDFSIPYMNAKVALITHSDNFSIKNFSDISGKIAAQSLTSNYSQLAKKYGAIIIATEGFNQSIELVLTGRADVILNDIFSFKDFKKKKPNSKLKIVSIEPINVQSAILLRKGEYELLEAINNALNEIKNDGIYKYLYFKYFDQNVSE